jgi:hypothetical protein
VPHPGVDWIIFGLKLTTPVEDVNYYSLDRKKINEH